MAIEDLVEPMIGGALVIIGIVLVLVAVGVVALSLLPIALGIAVVIIVSWIVGKIRSMFSNGEPELTEEYFRSMHESMENEEEVEGEPEAEVQEEPETALDEEKEEPKKEYDLSANLHLNSKLNEEQRGKLFAQRYDLVKISPFGTSGAAYYWVNTRYNESKEHAFFCYLLEAELKKYVGKVEVNVRRGPDLVVEHKGKRYCFDVETGKSLTRQPEWLKKKFAYYQKEYDKSFILVTKRTMKYKYTKYGIVITRGKIRETLRNLFRRKAYASCDKTELRNAL